MFHYYLIQGETQTEVSEPIGWDQFETTLKRTPRSGFSVEFSEIDLMFNCGSGGYDILLAEYSAHGNDGAIGFKQTYECNGNVEILYEGNVNFNAIVHVPGDFISTNLDNVSFSHKLRSRERTKFSMGSTVDLDGNAINPAPTAKLNMHSREILKQFEARDLADTTTTFVIPRADKNLTQLYSHKGWPDVLLDEIEVRHPYPTAFQVSDPIQVNEYLIEVKEAGYYSFDIVIYYDLTVTSNIKHWMLDLEFRWILRIDSTEYPLSGDIYVPGYVPPPDGPANYFSGHTISSISTTLFLNPGQKVYLFAYEDHRHLIEEVPDLALEERTFTLSTKATSQINIQALTTTPESVCQVWPVAEVLRQLILGTTGLDNRLKSDYFANCGSQYYLNNGFNIRQFTDKPLTLSRDEAWAGLNPILALGEGLTLDGSTELVEIEPVAHFYQDSEILVIANPSASQ